MDLLEEKSEKNKLGIKKSWWQKALINFGLMVLSFVFILAVLEIGVRIFAKPVYPILKSDKQVGKLYESNFEGKIWDSESQRWNYIKTNNLGYIGNDIFQKDKKTTRIAILGDSMTAALQVDWWKNFSSLLDTALAVSQSEKKYQILNFGVGGTGTFLQYQTYKYTVAVQKPDAAVVVFFENDFTDNLDRINFDLDNYFQAKDRNIWLKNFLLQFDLTRFVFNKLQQNFLFLKILDKIGVYELNQNLIDYNQGVDMTKNKDYYQYTFSIIKKFKEKCDQDQVRFYLALLPLEVNYFSKENCEKMTDYKKLKEFLDQEKINYINLCPLLAEVRSYYSKDKYFTFGQGGGHLNELGHKELAKILYQFIKNNL